MWDTTLNWLTGTGLVLNWFWYHKTQQALKMIENQRRDLSQSKLYALQSNRSQASKEFTKVLQQAKTSKLIIQVSAQNVKGLKPQTFSRIYRDLQVHTFESLFFNPLTHKFMERQAGGQFYLDVAKQKVKVDIRECNIDGSLLYKNPAEKLKLIEGNQPTYESVTYRMRTGTSLLLAGVLSYSLQQKQWVLLPSFLLNRSNWPGTQECLKEAFLFLQSKRNQQLFKQLLSICGFLLIIALRYKQLSNLFNSIWGKVKSLFQNKGKFEIGVLKEVVARQRDKLLCDCGKTLNVIFECKHLSSCQSCFEKDQSRPCRLCGAQGGRVIKVFT